MTQTQRSLTYAIDFGTSNSLLAAANETETLAPIPLDHSATDPTVFRTLLYFPHGESCFYGQTAIDEYIENSGQGRLIRSVKKYLPMLSYSGSWIDDRLVRLEDLIGFFLLEMRKRANMHFQQDVTSVILGRPARFSFDPEEDKLAQYRLQKAAEFAGFQEIEFLPEPIAAAFDLKKRLSARKTVLVVDLGGGTSDFTILEIGPEPFQESDILAMGGISVAGDLIDGAFVQKEISPYLGADVTYKVPLGRNILSMPKSLLDYICSPADITQLSQHHFFQFFRDLRNWALSEEDRVCLQRLVMIVEDRLGFRLFESVDRCKRQLSEQQQALFAFHYPDIEFTHPILRAAFEAAVQQPVSKIIAELESTLQQSGLDDEQIDLVYCTGGTAKLPVILNCLQQKFGADRIQSQDHFHSVTKGLAQRALEKKR